VIRTNLSTRPFYNERAVHIGLIALAVVVVAATAFNVSRVIRYSRSDTQLATQASRDESRAADLRQQAAQLRASVDPKQVEFASADARQANDLIDRRTFSWTELLNRFETTLPDEVHLTSVKPRLDRERGIVLLVSVVARSVDDIAEFMENLESTGAFASVRPAEDHVNEDGLLEAALDMTYTPGGKLVTTGRGSGGRR
jgi:type IV pilus assembly protein PilN